MSMCQKKKKKKKEVSYALVKSLLSYNFHEEVIDFFKICQEKKNYFFLVIFLFKLNHSVKSRYKYIILV